MTKLKLNLMRLMGCTVFFFPFWLAAQASLDNWGKINPDEFSFLEYADFPGEEAITLLDNGLMVVENGAGGRTIRIERHVRIRILTEKGLEHANITLPYYTKDQMEFIRGLEAQTLNLKNGAVSISKMTKSAVFRETVSENWGQVKFVLPGVKVGSILEYRYILTSTNIFSPPVWYFQSDIPTLASELQVVFPNDLEYTYFYKGHKGHKLEDMGSGRWRMKNLPALREEQFITTLRDHRQQIGFQLSAYLDRTGQVRKVLQRWEDFSRELMLEEGLGNKLRNDKPLTELAMALKKPDESPEQTVDRIFRTVRDRMTYNDQQRIFAVKQLSTVWEEKSGNSAEINLILVYLLRELGIESHPMLISTRSHGLVSDLHPMLSQFNQLLCYVRNGKQVWMLNAVNPLRSFDLPAIEDLNGRGWVLDEKNPRWEEVRQGKKHSALFKANMKLDAEGGLSGSIIERLTGYTGLPYRNRLLSDEEGFFQDYLKAYLISGKIDSAYARDADIAEQPISLYASLSSPDFSQKIGDVIYFRPMLHRAAEENPFLSTERLYPIDFGYPYQRTFLLELSIPEGFEVGEVPQAAKVLFPDKSASFEYAVVAEGNRIEVKSIFTLERSSFSPELYKGFKQLYDHMLAKHAEQITLRKKE